MVSTHLQPQFASYEVDEGVKNYSYKTLEGNWFEERTRAEHGEEMADSMFPEGTLMAGAKANDFDPDISIAPPNRDPLQASTGRLLCPERLTRSRITNNSSRQGADDGFREYTTMNNTFMPPPDQRPNQPISSDAGYHSTYGGSIQRDDLSKTRYSAQTRTKNAEREPAIKAAGDATHAQKLLNAATRHHVDVQRPSANSHRTTGFGSVLPHLPKPAITEDERLQTTSRMQSSWMGEQAVTFRTMSSNK